MKPSQLITFAALIGSLALILRSMNKPSNFRYFKLSEFDSPDAPGSGEKFMDRDFVALLDRIRHRAGIPFRILSGYRTPAHNAKVKGVVNSAHIKGMAADIRALTTEDKKKIASAAAKEGIKRIGWGSTFIHLDNDPTKPQNVVWGYNGNKAPVTLEQLRKMA
jgi:zinc D-Ala-D-Ala carboxypeptidase